MSETKPAARQVQEPLEDGKTPLIKQQSYQKKPVQTRNLEALGTLAGGIAHELNNILFIIQGYTDLALMDLEKNNNPTSKLIKVRNGCDRAANLISQILTFSGSSEQQRAPILIEPIVKQSIKFLKSVLPPTLTINQYINTKEQLKVSATPAEIQQVIVNICTNGAQAMTDNGSLLISLEECRIAADHPSGYIDLLPGRYLKLIVRDSGKGIEDCDIPRIFEPFFTTRDVGEGLGLGLSVVYGIISDIDGKIFVSSRKPVGTDFIIFLPACADQLAKNRDNGISILAGSEEHILLVEDDPVVLEMMENILIALNYQVTSCLNGSEADEVFRSTPDSFDLLLTDLMMPGISGETLSQKIRQINPDLPIILCTGLGDEVTPENINREIDIILSKPVLMESLGSALASLLRNRREQHR